ncbi:hypothetical protein FQZ97_1074350 [compost metagenome]
MLDQKRARRLGQPGEFAEFLRGHVGLLVGFKLPFRIRQEHLGGGLAADLREDLAAHGLLGLLRHQDEEFAGLTPRAQHFFHHVAGHGKFDRSPELLDDGRHQFAVALHALLQVKEIGKERL